jgi:hypothetical protein
MFTGAVIGSILVALYTQHLHYFEIIVGGIPGALFSYWFIQHYFERVGADAIFAAALIGEAFVIVIFVLDYNGIIELAYLWLNLIGCVLVIFFSLLIQLIIDKNGNGNGKGVLKEI